jgi:AraC-like DNA-binding protein
LGVFQPKYIAINSIDEKFLNRIIEDVELHIGDEKFGVEELGNETGMSRSQLHRKLTALLG